MNTLELEQRYHLLGNKIAVLIKEVKCKPVPINAVLACNQKRQCKSESLPESEINHSEVGNEDLDESQVCLVKKKFLCMMESLWRCHSLSKITKSCSCVCWNFIVQGFLPYVMSSCPGTRGQQKPKIVLHCYYWPNCYQKIERFVRTCDPCQKVSSNRNKC